MTDPSQYVFEKLRDDSQFILLRGRRDGEAGTILGMTASSEQPNSKTLARLEHAYSLRGDLDASSVALPSELVQHEGRRMLLIQDPGGEPLERLIAGPMEVGQFLRIAIGISGALGRFHALGFVHRDIKPGNILADPGSGRAWLAGICLVSRQPRQRQAPEPLNVIAGTLAYMAPEQTGRVNRSVDSRSDLYAFGVTLYEMITGALPFTATDPMEWVHCQIARQPIPPNERDHGIPEAVSSLVMRLLAKAPEERYQTAAGVEADLRTFLADWESVGKIERIRLGARDISDRLLIPETLYGREKEVERLLAAFDRVVSHGTAGLVLVSGYSGVGKSSVVNELHKALVPPRGLFASGKFDQFKRNIPYATLAQAFQRLIHQILIQSDEEVRHWRNAFKEALGPNGQLIVNLIPEIELIIGKQPPVPDLPPQDTKNRFQSVLGRFICVFARSEHPLALFLDDLQWLDAATLHLLEYLLTEPDVRHLMIVGAYRDNEVGADHPLMRTLEIIRQVGAAIDEIVLDPLGLEAVNALVADSLRVERSPARPLAQLLHEKTGGNPFFTIQFFAMLAEEGLLAFDPEAAAWKWDLERIRAKGYTDNVVVLMGGKLNRFSVQTQEALKHFACLGNAAEVSMLARACNETEDTLEANLAEAIQAGLVLWLEGACAFLHDRVHEAAYALIPEEDRPEMHLKIGRILAAHAPLDQMEENIFEIVNQLNRGSALIHAMEERERVASFNLVAGKRAKDSTAYASALAYLTAGRALLSDDVWERNYALVFQLEFHRADCEFLTGDLAKAEEDLSMLAGRAENIVDRASVTWLQVTLYTALDRSDLAIDICFQFLRGVGISWSTRPTREEARREYEQIWERLGDRCIEDLLALPLIADPAWQAVIEVLTALQPAALYMDENLNCLVVCRMVNLSLEYGNCDASCYAYVILGMILGPQFGAYQHGFRFGKLAFDLVENRGLERFKARVFMCFGNIVSPWRYHARTGRPLVQSAFAAARESGDLTFAVYSCHNLVTNLLVCSDPLDEVQREAEGGIEFARKARISLAVDFITGQLRLIMNLRGLLPKFGSFDDVEFEETSFERRLESNPSLSMATCWYWIRKLQARYHAGDFPTALAAAAKAGNLLWTSPSFLEVCDFHFYAALTRASHYDSASPDEQPAHLEALLAHRRQVGIGADNCPANFLNRAVLIDAEIARIAGRDLNAMRLYEQAIQLAREDGFIQNEGMAFELAARFHDARGFKTAANAHFMNARRCYLRWGAAGKVRELDQRHPYLGEKSAGALDPAIDTMLGQFDLSTIVKMSQAVFGEMVLDRLIERLMVIAIEHAGAVRGLLLLPHGGQLRIEAEATTSHDSVAVCLRQAPANSAELPESILRYVVRSQESVILDDATAANQFSADEYLRHRTPRSVLCLPLIRQTRLVGALYLENNLSSHVFTPQRITVLQLLASQAAISLENARLYMEVQQAEEKARQREKDFRLAFDTIPTLAWSALPDGSMEFLNQQWHDYTGLSLSEGFSGGWKSTIHADDLEEFTAQRLRILASGKSGELEARIRRFDGEYRSFLIRATPLRDETENIVRWYGTNTDMEDRKQAEALLAGEKRLLEMIATGHPLAEILDALCRIVEKLNAGSLASILLIDPDSKRLRHRAAPNLPSSYVKAIDNSLIDPPSSSYGAAVYRGEKISVLDISEDPSWTGLRELAMAHDLRAFWSIPIFSSQGAILGAFAIYWRKPRQMTPREAGITQQFTHLASIVVERRRAETALKKSEAFLAEGQRISRTGSWSWNIATGKLVWSEESYHIFGYDPQAVEPTFQALIERIHLEDRLSLERALDGAIRDGRDFSCEYRIVLPDGSVKHLQSVGRRMMKEAGGSDEYIGTTMDVTDRKRAEEELRKSEQSLRKAHNELAHVTRVTTMGELAASIAHEVSQPLAGIVMNGNVILRWLSADPPNLQEIREANLRVIRDGKRAADVIARIRTLFKKVEPVKERLDVNEVIHEVIVLMRNELQKSKVSLSLSLASDLAPALGDRVQLQQVMMNLILNGIDAMNAVDDRPRELFIETRDPGDYEISILVRDSGIGLTEKDAERIFDAFQTTKPGGLGMGLSISRSIVESHGGQLHLLPQDGPGAAFRFTLLKFE